MNTRFTTLLLAMLIAVVARAEQKPPEVSAASQQIRLTMYGQPHVVDAKALPFVDGRSSSGKRERIGFRFAGKPRSAAVIELLGPGDIVVKSITLADILGEGSSVGLSSTVLNDRRLESRYTATLPDGKLHILVRGLVMGDADSKSGGQQLVLSFGVRSEKSLRATMRVTLPVMGSAEVREGSILIASASGAASLAAVAVPTTGSISLKKNAVTLTSPAVEVEGDRDTAMLWLLCQAFAGTNAKARSSAWAREAKPAADDPRIIVVSSVNKEATQPGDTITYTLVCSNIGTGNATDVALNNPIPDRARYIEDTATENGFRVSYARAEAAAPAQGNVKAITWKLPNALKPGEERMVSFRVVIQ